MLGKRCRPMIGKITELLVSGNRAVFFDAATSPKSPSEFKIQSPRGVKNYDLGGGVGLGIVVALDKSGGVGTEFLAKYAMTSPKSTRTDPIPVNSVKNCNKVRGYNEEPEMDRFENCSYLKSSSSSSSSSPCHDRSRTVLDKSKSGFDRKIQKNTSIFTVSPAICPEDTHSTTSKAFPMTDFLSSCHACRKNLHGKDIYMYRGEKAFCSTECRARQIRIDERKEQCRSEATRSVDVSNSPCAQGNIFSTGILAV